MGLYLNPTEDGFREILNNGLYVDKTGLISYTNKVLGTAQKLTCFSRPRRFGKSFAAKMLAAYYSKGADSETLFQNLAISRSPHFLDHLNKYDVLLLDMSWFISIASSIETTVTEMQAYIIEELRENFPDCISDHVVSLPVALAQISFKKGIKFFVIIDEWDALFRESKNSTALQKSYIQLLRGLFKGMQTSQVVIGAYMTGILPIKKYGSQSALTDFYEYTMLEPGPLAEFVGFTELEVQDLCRRHKLDFEQAQIWYDGYYFDEVGHVYNPNSIIKAILNQKFANYWTQTETYESLKMYIDLNYDGLKDAILDMLGGLSRKIDTGTFQNDMTTLESKDDVFTLLAHLGYLAYNNEQKTVFIPNEEIREEFIRAVKNGSRPELVKAIETSDKLLKATLQMDSDTVAELIENAHNANTAPNYYNNEQALRSVIVMAYLSCVDYYSKFEELSSGKGFVDILFLPKLQTNRPALIIEMKWNKTAESAVTQIKDRDYMRFVEKVGYKGDVLLIGINYDVKSQHHSCVIEKEFV